MGNKSGHILSAEEIETFAVWVGSVKTYNIPGLLRAQQSLATAEYKGIIHKWRVSFDEAIEQRNKLKEELEAKQSYVSFEFLTSQLVRKEADHQAQLVELFQEIETELYVEDEDWYKTLKSKYLQGK